MALKDEEFARLSELLGKTEKTPEEEKELRDLKTRALAADEVAPPELPRQELPVGMQEALRLIQEQKAQFAALQKVVADQASVIQTLKDGQDAVASGQLRVSLVHCNVDGERFSPEQLQKNGGICPRHPNEAVNHVGLNPANGVMMIVKQTGRNVLQ